MNVFMSLNAFLYSVNIFQADCSGTQKRFEIEGQCYEYPPIRASKRARKSPTCFLYNEPS